MSSQSMQRLVQGLCIFLFLSSAPALAQKENPITWTVASEQTAQPLKAGATFKAQLTARIEERWHLYAMELPHEGPRHFGLEHPAYREDLAGLFHGGCGHESASRRLELDQAVLRELEQRLAHQRARHTEVISQLLLGKLGARLQPVFDDGAGEGLDDETGGGRLHGI